MLKMTHVLIVAVGFDNNESCKALILITKTTLYHRLVNLKKLIKEGARATILIYDLQKKL